jgi:dihydroorotate dehydrogenase (fumarate)
MVDLTTKYLGLDLKNPLVVSASPLSENVETVQRLEANGAAAVVMYSLFEEQIIHESLELDHYLTRGSQSYPEAITYLPDLGRYSIGTEAYLKNLENLKKAVQIPIMGSLNGVSSGGWIEQALRIESAGADGLELNIYYMPTDPVLTAEEMEDNYVKLVSDIRAKIQVPIAVKLSPFFTALPNIARRLVEAGANGLVLFNRFYQPDFDLERLEVVPNLELSTSQELRLPLRWVALMYGQIEADIALTTGIHTHLDMLKALMAGASVTMVASSLLRNGLGHASVLLRDLQEWMECHEYQSVEQMKGSLSAKGLGQTQQLERANYMKELSSYNYLP